MRSIVTILLLAVTLCATSMELKKGWQLVGLPIAIDDLLVFEKHVEIIWAYDTATKSWRAYTSDDILRDKLKAKAVDELLSLRALEAFWIKSRDDWLLELNSTLVPTSEPKLDLKSGWNLLSFGDRAVVDTALFEKMGLRLYKYDGNWSSTDDTDLYPRAQTLSLGEGFWLYSDIDQQIELSKELSKLHNFSSRVQMLEHIEKMVQSRHLWWSVNEDLSGGDDQPSRQEVVDNTTGTNTQEDGIDESDILKHDAEKIFFYDALERVVRVYTFADILNAKQTSRVQIDINGTLSAMYLKSDQLYIIRHPSYNSMFLDIYDVSTIDQISKLSSIQIDGSYRESRVKGDSLYLISSFYPSVEYGYPSVYPETNCTQIYRAKLETPECIFKSPISKKCVIEPLIEGEPVLYEINQEFIRLEQLFKEHRCNRYRYDENLTAYYVDYDSGYITKRDFEPKIDSKTLLQPKSLYAPYKLNQESYITSIIEFDLNGTMQDSISYIGSADVIYLSNRSIYLSSTQYPRSFGWGYTQDRLSIYKFALDENLSFRGRGLVDGRALSQYSLSEYNSTLRIATTTGWDWWGSAEISNDIYTLQESDGELKVVGELKGLGKEGETIRAVRFIGDRGFVVTFRQSDPFYTIDLSNPEDIKKVGELEIDGFSSYLHPIDRDRILSIGRDADADGVVAGLQIQLFDISDFASVKLVDKVLIGDRSTYSTAESNPRAFIYRASDKLFGFPYSKSWHSLGRAYSGFLLYGVDAFKINFYKKFEMQSDGSWYRIDSRGIIFDSNGSKYAVMFQADRVMLSTIEQR